MCISIFVEFPLNIFLLLSGIDVWNPAFDVTPAELITGGIITEFGVVQAPMDTKENLEIMKMKM